MNLRVQTVTRKLCGFLERPRGHTGSYTTGAGTFCSSCGNRIFNPHYTGSYDVEGDMEIIEKLHKKGTLIPNSIKQEIWNFQTEVGWKPRWTWCKKEAA